jgi:hypothetical protein
MALELNRGSRRAAHGRMKDAGTLRQEHVSPGKMGNVRGAIEVARSARTILGANGVTLEYPVIRHVNNLESVLTYEDARGAHARRRPGADRRRTPSANWDNGTPNRGWHAAAAAETESERRCRPGRVHRTAATKASKPADTPRRPVGSLAF